MRAALMVAVLLIGGSSVGKGEQLRFVSPLERSQPIGLTPVEIATSIEAVDRVDFFVGERLIGAARSAPFRLIHDFGVEGRSTSVSAVVHFGGFTQQSRITIALLPLTLDQTLTVNLVEVPLRVRSRRPLRAEDLQLTEDGRRQEIVELRQSRLPSSFVFVVDRSLSMDGGRLEAAIEAVDTFRATMLPDDDASIILFNQRVERAVPLTAGRTTAAHLGELTPSGGTSLRDALVSIERQRRTHVVVITDGDDRNSAADPASTIRHIAGRDVTIHSIVFGSDSPFLRQLAERSGGIHRRSSAARLGEVMADLAADINGRVTAIYQSSNHGSGWRTIAVKPRRSGMSLLTVRKGYYSE
jgi:uncharacterized protein YegL